MASDLSPLEGWILMDMDGYGIFGRLDSLQEKDRHLEKLRTNLHNVFAKCDDVQIRNVIPDVSP